jgi:hypothetical protein
MKSERKRRKSVKEGKLWQQNRARIFLSLHRYRLGASNHKNFKGEKRKDSILIDEYKIQLPFL